MQKGVLVGMQVFFVFAVVTNLLVSTSMLQGCVAVVNALTGVNSYGESPIPFLVSPPNLEEHLIIWGHHCYGLPRCKSSHKNRGWGAQTTANSQIDVE